MTHTEPRPPSEEVDAAESPSATAPATRRPSLSIVIAPRSVWYFFGAVLTLGILWLLVTRALGALIIIFVAIIIGEACRPLVLRLERRGIPRPLGVLLTIGGAAVVLGALIWLIIAPLIGEVGTLANNAPSYAQRAQALLTLLSERLHTNAQVGQFTDSLASRLAGAVQGFVPTLVSLPLAIVSTLFGGFINVVITLTLTIFWVSSSSKLAPFLLSLFPLDTRDRVHGIFADMGRSLGGYVRGVLIAMVLIGVFTMLGLAILGVPYAVLLGVLAGLLEALPYIGPWISGGVAVVVALVTVDPVKALEVAILFLIIQLVEGNLVQPLVMSRAVHLDPMLVLVAILIGSQLLGLFGAILAVPFAALVQTVLADALAPAIRTAVGAGPPPSESPPPHAGIPRPTLPRWRPSRPTKSVKPDKPSE